MTQLQETAVWIESLACVKKGKTMCSDQTIVLYILFYLIVIKNVI